MASRAGGRRPRRWGAGVEPTYRDVTALAWVGEQYAVRADVLGLLLGRLSPDTPRVLHRWQYAPGRWAELPALSEATVRYHLRRWLRAGWVQPQRALGRTWIVPTRGGLDLAGSGYRPWTVVPSQLQHLHAVAVVRLAIETATPNADWISERALTRLRAQTRGSWWRPDGGLVVADVAVSGGPPLHTIEVELTPKHLVRLQQVFEHRYPGEVQTTYFTPPPAHQDRLRRRLVLIEQATRARNEPWSQVNVMPLPALPGVSYEGAA